MNWYRDTELCLGLCEWLNFECVMFHDAGNAIDMLRKPYRWHREYTAWQLWSEVPANCPRSREMVVVAVIEGAEIDSHFAVKVRESYKREQCGSKHHSFPQRFFNLVFGCTEPEGDDDE